jgi:drug/metabolite transporter (DMT)-like permease
MNKSSSVIRTKLKDKNMIIHTDENAARGYTLALVSAIVLSTTGILIRYLTQTYQLPSLILAFWRDGFAALSLFLIMLLLGFKKTKLLSHHKIFLLGFGLVLAFFNALWTLSVSLNGAAIATVLGYCSAGFTVLLGWGLLKETLGWVKILVVFMTLGGCLLVSGAYKSSDWEINTTGILTGIFSGLGYALYTLMGRIASKRGIDAWTTLLYTFSYASIFLLIFNLIPSFPFLEKTITPKDLFWLGNAYEGWGILFLLAIGPTVAGFGLYNMSLGYLPASIVNLLVTTEPVFTAIIAYYFLGERLDIVQGKIIRVEYKSTIRKGLEEVITFTATRKIRLW